MAAEQPPLPETISPEAKAMITALNAAPAPATEPPIADMRAMMATVQQQVAGLQQARHPVIVEDAVIAGVPVRVFTPKGGVTSDAVLVNLHGGGFMVDSGSLTENIPLSALTGMKIVAVLYRLAPEHPFPAAVDDTIAVYRELLKTRKASRIALFGTSAGAVLTAQAIVRMQAEGLPAPKAAGFFSGSADFVRDGDSEQFLPKLNGKSLLEMSLPYVGATSKNDPLLSPLYADLKGFPPTLVLTSTRDQLLSQSTIFHRALLKAGTETELVVFEAMPHAFWAYIQAPETDEAFAIMARFFRTHLP